MTMSHTSLHLRGADVGGSTERLGDASLVYRYRLEFAQMATLTSVSVSGAAFNGSGQILRALDEDMNIVGSVDTVGGNLCLTLSTLLMENALILSYSHPEE